MLSEWQERMLLVAESGGEREVLRGFEKWGLDAVIVGKVTNNGRLRVLEHGQQVADIPNTALTDDAPLYKRPMEPWEPPVPRSKPDHIFFRGVGDFTRDLKRLLAAPNLCSKRWIFEQYDSMVQTNTVEGPGADAGLMRIKGTQRALAMALDAMTFHFRQPDREVFLLSGHAPGTAARETEFGSSEYAKEILGAVWGLPPALDLKQEAALQKCVRELIQNHDIESAHDCSEGGLAVALAESAFPAGVGAEIGRIPKGYIAGAGFLDEAAPPGVRMWDAQDAEQM